MHEYFGNEKFISCNRGKKLVDDPKGTKLLKDNYPLKLTPQEKLAIGLYSSDDDSLINDYFRKKSIYLKKDIYINQHNLNNTKFQYMIHFLDSAVNKHSLKKTLFSIGDWKI